MAWLTTRLLSYALAATFTLGALTTGWQYLGKVQAQRATVAAEQRAFDANTKAQAVADKLAAQNAAVLALNERLKAAQGTVDRAQQAAKKASAVSEARISRIRTETPVASCDAAISALADYLEGRE